MKTVGSLVVAAMLAAVGSAGPLVPRQTENASGTCADITVVFARGTTERGNVGTIAGPPMFEAIKAQAGGMSVNVQGVEYPANIPGFLAGGDANGSTEMANQVQQLLAACPNTQMVMAGYSQGGQLVHNAADQLPADVTSRVSSAVIFGDPLNGKAVTGVGADRTMVICHNGDNICEGGNRILMPHLTYGQDADSAANFVVANAKAGAAAGAAAPAAGA